MMRVLGFAFGQELSTSEENVLSENSLSKVNICFAIDDNYAMYLKVALRSLLHNRNREFGYHVLILHTDVTKEHQDEIVKVAEKEEGVEVVFVDVTKEASLVHCDINSYMSIATTYRLLLLSDMFSHYEKILYLDSDLVVEGDISELFFCQMNDFPVAAVEETGFRQMSYAKKAVFINGSLPYNVDNYRTEALKMKHPERYFNAGVVLFDLKKCRECVTFEDVLNVVRSKNYFYNDQDILNILFDGQVCLLDYSWNYQNNVEAFLARRPELYGPMYSDVKREFPNVIHYVSSYKPWKDQVVLGEHYHKYEDEG